MGKRQQKEGNNTMAKKKVYYNGYIYTVNADRDVAEAVVLEDDKIIFVGSNAEAKSVGGEEAQLIDLEGHMMLPGFIDGHCHPILAAHMSCGVELDIDSNTEENLQDIRAFVEAHPEKDSYLGSGYAEWNFDEHGPTKEPLDEICSDKPILIMSSSDHDAWVNSKTLELAGITKDTPDPVPGVCFFGRDKDGNPSGYAAECKTVNMIFEKLNFFDMDIIKDMIWQVSKDYASNGVTTTADMGVLAMIGIKNYRMGLEIMRNSGFLQRFNGPGLTVVESAEVDEAIEYIHALKEEYDDDKMRIALLKLIDDGTMESRTAANTEAYPEDGSFVKPLFTTEELTDAMLKGARNGFDINVHAIGNAAAKDVLAAAKAVREAGFDDTRITCSHCQYIDPEDVPLFAKYDVTANSTGVWFYANPLMDEMLGHINDETFRMKSLKDTGARIGFGSDFPVDEYGNEPLKSIEMAVTRKMYGQPDAEMLKPYDEVLTVDDGIAGYTIHNAYQLHMEDRLGSIETGKYADLIVLEKNLFDIAPEEIHEVKVLETIIGGETVYILQ